MEIECRDRSKGQRVFFFFFGVLWRLASVNIALPPPTGYSFTVKTTYSVPSDNIHIAVFSILLSFLRLSDA